ncbi:hypothetical protein SAM40697_6630 [Streptomyces ambofaciens]|uniref:STAS domain-containing protein n=2 Tax=Streptomyces ambofaciens TaxID=1889 RepID=A0ABM6B9L8_STRAM|nr:hypothetical protein SAM40697_6630 [Streptomyces ambofaciens]
MPQTGVTESVAAFLERRQEQIAQRWAELPLFRTVFTVSRDEAVEACRAVVAALAQVTTAGRVEDVEAPGFGAVREQLARIAASRGREGRSAGQVAGEVSALKRAVCEVLEHELGDESLARRLAETVVLTDLMGTLRLVVMETTLAEGQEVILRQSQQMLEMTTPVIKLWEGVVAVPLIGTLDSARSQVVMESLLEAIVDQHASHAILDITGVPTVDTLVAQHLMKTVAAARLMGAECIISGVRPVIAQTIVQLGIDLSTVTTRATLADALFLALGDKESTEGLRPAAAGSR